MTEQRGARTQVRTYDIDIGDASGVGRLDAYLAARFPDYSRTFINRLIRSGWIEVNGSTVKPSYRPACGDRIVARVPAIDYSSVEPENIELDIVYEDEWILVINKPYDMVVHPSRGHQSGTLVNAAAYHCNRLSDCGNRLRPGIVHRLDRDTTGVIIMVKDDSVHEAIAKQFEKRSVEKEYVAVCNGTVELDSDIIEAPIGKHNSSSEKMAVRYDRGKAAGTIYRVQERLLNATVVQCFPISGRTHQIRVHMRHIGHPILCDPLYGQGGAIYESDLTGAEHCPSEEPVIERQALHAAHIRLFHPALKKWVGFQAPLPEDMSRLIGLMRRAGTE